MKILITGGAGYIGSMLVPAILKNEHHLLHYDMGEAKLHVADLFLYDQTPFLDHCMDERLVVERVDVTSKEWIQRITQERWDYVIPLACYTGAGLSEEQVNGAWDVNYHAVANLLDELDEDTKVIFPNTNSGYGQTDGTTICTEESPMNPISVYGESKASAEDRVREHSKHVCFRLATVFGASPRMRMDLLVNDFVHRALRDRVIVLFEEHFMRNYIHIRDVVRAFIFAIDNPSMFNGVYNLGNDSLNMSKRGLCEEINKYLDFEIIAAPFAKDPDQRNYIVSSQKLYDADYFPLWDLKTGIKELITAYEIIKITQYRNH
jgi:nucleoside-diphosphate-sugar epimerase